MTCQLTFLPVGNADSIIVQTDNSTIIVDLGRLSILEDWLQKHQVSKIDRIYITHAHGDHFPSLIKLKDFLSEWLDVLPIGKIHLPYQVIETAWKKVVSDSNSLQTGKLRLALKSISEWSRNRQIKFSPIVRDGEEYHEGVLKIEALHPSQDYVENHLALSYSKLNEISTVLQVSYGEFSAILLADIEGEGLKELLSFLKANSEDVDFVANVVKIPHHGAYPTNGDDLRDLLALIDAEIAVLSVGSKNTYGHVEPELFKVLIELQNNDVQRLKQFICTEVTRTCIHSASHRVGMRKSGLRSSEKCAGEITIIADISGIWNLETEEVNHQNRIKSFNHAACDGRADL
ncbi:MAG: hypothetical protein KME27_29150 [Lyngbya sp. HA4199-MV5]|jgi:beta-lactamase superfamily II metal-dependent hydrolase|nr:hypothetical protein [Lyngbya sp. HA4199-MV5]